MSTYRARPTRRTRAQMDELRTALYDIIDRYKPMTVRQVFYQMVGRGLIDKTEAEYKSTVVRLLSEMRKDGSLPYYWISDNTRWMRKPSTYDGLGDMLRNAYASYRRSFWESQNAYIEIWLEKEALAGVLMDATAEYDIPLMVTRGYPSISFAYTAADAIREVDKPVYIYYFGDHDPSGEDITRNVEQVLRERAPDTELYFEKVAVDERQIQLFDLPTRPTKSSDSRSKSFTGESVELDAIDPPTLRSLAAETILMHVDRDAWIRMRDIEQQEREQLRQLAAMISETKGDTDE